MVATTRRSAVPVAATLPRLVTVTGRRSDVPSPATSAVGRPLPSTSASRSTKGSATTMGWSLTTGSLPVTTAVPVSALPAASAAGVTVAMMK